MNAIRLAIISILPAVLFQSCVSTGKLMRQNSMKESSFSAATLNGTYINSRGGDTTNTLWSLFYDAYTLSVRDDKYHISPTASILLNYSSKGKLTVTANDTGGKTSSIVLKAKQRGNYLRVKRRLFLIPVPFLFYRHDETLILLSNDPDGTLNVQYGSEVYAWIIMAGSSSRYHDYRYRRREL